MTKLRLYVDEVGNPDLGHSDDPNHRFLSLTGVALDLRHVDEYVHPQLEALKQRYFGSHPDDPVILHRKEMVNAKGPFAVLKDAATRSVLTPSCYRCLVRGSMWSSACAWTKNDIVSNTRFGATIPIITA